MIWVIESNDFGEWRFLDYELSRANARAELEVYRAMHRGVQFRIRKWVRAE